MSIVYCTLYMYMYILEYIHKVYIGTHAYKVVMGF